MKEIANYLSFLKICEQLVQIDEKICDLRPVGEPENNSGLEALRKELQTLLNKKYKKKLSVS